MPLRFKHFIHLSELVICFLGILTNGRSLRRLRTGATGSAAAANSSQFNSILGVTSALSLLLIVRQVVFVILPDNVTFVSDYVLPIAYPWAHGVETAIDIMFAFLPAMLCYERACHYGRSIKGATTVKLWKIFTPIGLIGVIFSVPAFFEFKCTTTDFYYGRRYSLEYNDFGGIPVFKLMHLTYVNFLICHIVPIMATLFCLFIFKRKRAAVQESEVINSKQVKGKGHDLILEVQHGKEQVDTEISNNRKGGSHEKLAGSDRSVGSKETSNQGKDLDEEVHLADDQDVSSAVSKEGKEGSHEKITGSSNTEPAEKEGSCGEEDGLAAIQNGEMIKDKICMKITMFFLTFGILIGILRIVDESHILPLSLSISLSLYYWTSLLVTILTSFPMIFYIVLTTKHDDRIRSNMTL